MLCPCETLSSSNSPVAMSRHFSWRFQSAGWCFQLTWNISDLVHWDSPKIARRGNEHIWGLRNEMEGCPRHDTEQHLHIQVLHPKFIELLISHDFRNLSNLKSLLGHFNAFCVKNMMFLPLFSLTISNYPWFSDGLSHRWSGTAQSEGFRNHRSVGISRS